MVSLETHTTDGLPRQRPRYGRVVKRHRKFIADVEDMLALGRNEDQITDAMGYDRREHFRRQLERLGRRDIVLRFMQERGTAPVKSTTHNMRSTS